MKRYNITAHTGAQNQAIATFFEHKSGRFVEFKDVEDIIKKSEYWEEQFRQEWRRVGELCNQRYRAKRELKKIQENWI